MDAESLAKLGADMMAAATQLGGYYTEMADLLAREHDCVRVGHLRGVEDLVRPKTELGGAIEKAFYALMKHGQKIAAELGAQPKAPVTLTALDRLLAGQSALSALRDALQSLQRQLLSVYPTIKTNAILVERMLHDYQASFRFWQGALGQLGTPYDRRGQRVANAASASMQVRA